MEILRNIIGTLSSGIVRLLVTVGILAAAYLFIVKPVLNSADKAIDSTNQTIQKSFESSGFDDIGKSIKRQINHSYRVTKRHGGNPERLIHCVQNSNGDVNKLQRCTRRF
jgi:hypothetical protein